MLLCFKHAVLPEIISLWNNQEHKETVARIQNLLGTIRKVALFLGYFSHMQTFYIYTSRRRKILTKIDMVWS